VALSLTVTWLIQAGNEQILFGFQNASWLAIGMYVAREAVIGTLLGYGFGLFLLPARIAGSYIAQEMGLSIATLTDPSSGESSTVVGELFFVLSMLVFLISDSHLLLLRSLFRSFQTFPVAGGFETRQLILVSKGLSDALGWGIQVAAPVAAILLLTTVVLATMMKAVPQFNLFTFGSALRVAGGLLSLFIFVPETVMLMNRVFSHMHAVARHLGL
jgi:flagellar biosynthetic protein FliR